ncbi:MAG: hypothetical protein GYB68_13730 [Chloroflexi bacterium]|nr:hypothetical protein [Chloroflexota bacterium]
MSLDGSTAMVVFPIVAIVLALLSVAGIAFWWFATRDDEEEEIAEESFEQAARPAQAGRPQNDDGPGLFEALAQDLGFAQPKPANPDWANSLPSGTPKGDAVAASAPVASQSVAVPPSPAYSPSDEIVEVMRLYRDLADGSLLVEIGGIRYGSVEQMEDSNVQRRFLGTARALTRFAEGADGTNLPPRPPAPSPVAAPPTVSQPAPVQPSVAPPPPPQSAPVDEDEEEEAARSMAEEIEELLQYRLTLTPNMAHRSVHIRGTPSGNIRIEVDGQFFETVGDVADNAVREFIISVIREWESRQ